MGEQLPHPNPKSQGADEKEFDEKDLLLVLSRRGDRPAADEKG